MMGIIEFFDKLSGNAVNNHTFFVMDNKVYRDNYSSCESQQATVSFDDFIVECPDVDWRVVAPTPVFDAMNLPETPAFPSIRGKA